MVAKRKDDATISRSQHRSDRVVKDSGKWFFLTREGTVEGPFECEADALEQLEVYVRLAVNDFLPHQSALSLQD